jgi:hypothetical protein
MKDTNIDRLYAHRNNLVFPYVELINESTANYVKVEQNLEYLQYFFTAETTAKLSNLCIGYTACLVTPSIAVYSCSRNKNVVLFERDNRFRQTSGLKFVKYDLETGLTILNQRRYSNYIRFHAANEYNSQPGTLYHLLYYNGNVSNLQELYISIL